LKTVFYRVSVFIKIEHWDFIFSKLAATSDPLPAITIRVFSAKKNDWLRP
jgi:hypothetical protein